MALSGGPGDRSFLVPIVALGSTLFALVIAIVLVLVLRSGGLRDLTGPDPDRSADRGADCLVGIWRVTSHSEQVDVPGVGRLTFTGGIGSGVSMSADGTGITDYGTGTLFRSGYAGQDVVLELRGTVGFRYQVTGDRIELHDVRSDAEVRLRVGAGTPGPWQDFTASIESSSYACAGDSLTRESLLSGTSYARSD